MRIAGQDSSTICNLQRLPLKAQATRAIGTARAPAGVGHIVAPQESGMIHRR
jgi:hypothetical protein